MSRPDAGFTLVEVLVATSLTICIAAAVFTAVRPAEDVFGVQSEAVDMQQRLRVAKTALASDLAAAGAGTDGQSSEALVNWFPPVLPYRPARMRGDPVGTYRSDAITLIWVPSRSAQTTTSSVAPARSTDVQVNTGPGCPIVDLACGFAAARTAVVFDESGSFDRFRIAGVAGSRLELQHTFPDSSKAYPGGTRIVEVISRSFFLEADPRRATYQLMRDDGDGRAAVPVVDHVVQLVLEYFGDPRPPARPAPPAQSQQLSSYPPGENCLFARDGATNAISRLPQFAPTTPDGLVRLDAARLTDGPWCPDPAAANRFDGDLLRIRRIAVTLRVESSVDALRGPAGALFSRSGTASGGRYLPDQIARFEIAPRNMTLGR